jgi:hypothetical protein
MSFSYILWSLFLASIAIWSLRERRLAALEVRRCLKGWKDCNNKWADESLRMNKSWRDLAARRQEELNALFRLASQLATEIDLAARQQEELNARVYHLTGKTLRQWEAEKAPPITPSPSFTPHGLN